MGTVWKAYDLKLSRTVALKFLNELGSDQARAQFEKQAKILAQLKHPSIPGVFDTGDHRGLFFIAMEFIPGRPLGAVYRELDLRVTLESMRAVCDAIAHAHAHHVLHRDLKPWNILREPDGRTHVLDFGMASHTYLGETDDRKGGFVTGTPEYLSPEQARGDKTTERTDVHGLGATLYALCTGRPPFSGLSPAEIAQRVIEDRPDPPRRHNPALPEALESLIVSSMEKDPSKRPASARELGNALQSIDAGGAMPADGAKLTYATSAGRAVVLLKVLAKDGTPIGCFPILEGDTRIGRTSGEIRLPDKTVGGEHATVTPLPGGGGVTVRDHSKNGTWIQAPRNVLKHRSGMVWFGQEFGITRYRLQVLAPDQGATDVHTMTLTHDATE